MLTKKMINIIKMKRLSVKRKLIFTNKYLYFFIMYLKSSYSVTENKNKFAASGPALAVNEWIIF